MDFVVGTALVLPVPTCHTEDVCQSEKDVCDNKLRSRAWCFTHPYDEYVICLFNSIKCERLVVGVEEGGTTGYRHLQGYVRFKDAKRFEWWKTNFPKAHVEVRKGSESQASSYCMKDGNIVIDKGFDYDEPSRRMGRDDEAIEIIKEIESGLSYGQIRNRHKLFCFWNRDKVIKYYKDELHLKNSFDVPEY